MSWFPGWDSIASAHWWENFYFWASIIALILLGVTEVISHRYTERKDELTEQQQIAAQHQHDKDIAALHLQAAELEKQAATANERAATAEQKAAEANLALELYRAPRVISDEQQKAIKAAVSPFAGVSFVAGVRQAGRIKLGARGITNNPFDAV